MKCPIDGTTLMIADRSGVEIDYCPQCRGVWLDRGELDKIIERADTSMSPPPPPPPQGAAYATPDRHGAYGGKPKKKKTAASILGGIFDF